MQNIFVMQFPESRFNPEAVVEALKNDQILSSREWEVWPFLANLQTEDEEDDEEHSNAQDRILIAFMRRELLRKVEERVASGAYETVAMRLISELGYPVNRKTKDVVVKSLTAFRMIFSLCIAASYARIFIGPKEGMALFLKVWNKEVTLACKMDSAYRSAFGTQGLICKNPRELMTLFVKVTVAELLACKDSGKGNSVTKVAQKVSSGILTVEILQSWEEVLKVEIDAVLASVGSFFSSEDAL